MLDYTISKFESFVNLSADGVHSDDSYTNRRQK